MIKLNTWKKMVLMVFLINQTFASHRTFEYFTDIHICTASWEGRPKQIGGLGFSRFFGAENSKHFGGVLNYNIPPEIHLSSPFSIRKIKIFTSSNTAVQKIIFYVDGKEYSYGNDNFSKEEEFNLDKDESVSQVFCDYGTIIINRLGFVTSKGRKFGNFEYGGWANHNIEMMSLADIKITRFIELRFTDLVHRGFYNAFAALGDTVSNHQNREHHTNEFLRRADPLGNPGFKPLEYFCGALDTRFKRLDEKDADTLNQLAQLRDTFWARNGERETQVRDIWGGINEAREQIQQKDSAIQELKNSVKELQAQVTALTAENQRLITIVNGHERMVDDIERSTTPTSRRSLSAGRQARH
ncbi:MAG: hypothetical protein CNLJKLNK_01346 [Holosporales bacterium]